MENPGAAVSPTLIFPTEDPLLRRVGFGEDEVLMLIPAKFEVSHPSICYVKFDG